MIKTGLNKIDYCKKYIKKYLTNPTQCIYLCAVKDKYYLLKASQSQLDALFEAAKELETTAAGFLCLCIENKAVLAPILRELSKGQKLRKPHRKDRLSKFPANERE